MHKGQFSNIPHFAFCTLGCGLLFGLPSFPFSSLIPLLGVFPLFIYLLMRNYAVGKAWGCWALLCVKITAALQYGSNKMGSGLYDFCKTCWEGRWFTKIILSRPPEKWMKLKTAGLLFQSTFAREFLASSSGRHSNLSIWRCSWSCKAFFGLSLFYFLQSSPGKWETLQDSENWPSLLLSSLNLALGYISLSATFQRSECIAWKTCNGYMRIGVTSSLLFFPFFQ